MALGGWGHLFMNELTHPNNIKKRFEQIFIVLSSFKETKHIFRVPKHTHTEKTHTVKQDTWGETVNESKDWKSLSHKYTIKIIYYSCDRLWRERREWLSGCSKNAVQIVLCALLAKLFYKVGWLVYTALFSAKKLLSIWYWRDPWLLFHLFLWRGGIRILNKCQRQ